MCVFGCRELFILHQCKLFPGNSNVIMTVGVTGQTDGTNTFYFRYDENDNLVGFELGSNQYFYITNLVGDIIAIVDNQGATMVEYTYNFSNMVFLVANEVL